MPLNQEQAQSLQSLLAEDGRDPESVREKLEAFYQEASKSSSASFGEDVAAYFSDALKKNLVNPSEAEKARMEGLCKAFVLVGKALDKERNKEGVPSPAYHDRAHNLLVMVTSVVAVQAEEEAGKPAKTNLEKINNMVGHLAALGHDLGHDGTNNRPEGSYIPGKLEMDSFQKMEKCLEEAGVSGADQSSVETMLYATDADTPRAIMAQAYAIHFGGESLELAQAKVHEEIAKSGPENRAELMAFWQTLKNNPALTRASMKLQNCDMAQSYGVSLALWMASTAKFDKEFASMNPGKSLLDEAGRPEAGGQKFVMATFFDKDAETGQPKFAIPVMDRLFGGVLRKIHQTCVAPAASVGPPRPVAAARGAPLLPRLGRT